MIPIPPQSKSDSPSFEGLLILIEAMLSIRAESETRCPFTSHRLGEPLMAMIQRLVPFHLTLCHPHIQCLGPDPGHKQHQNSRNPSPCFRHPMRAQKVRVGGRLLFLPFEGANEHLSGGDEPSKYSSVCSPLEGR